MANDFMEKIVQYPTDLPAADKNEIDRFLIYSDALGHQSHLDELLDRLGITGTRRSDFDKKSVEIYASTLGAFFPTLRNAKRFLFTLSVRFPVVKDEVNLFDFFLLEVIRVFANSVYQDIWVNAAYYLPPWTTKLLLSPPFGLETDDRREKHRELIRAHVEKVLVTEPYKENVLSVLKVLFPARIADAFGRPTGLADHAIAGLRMNKRLTHPECFDKYFLLAVPKGIIPDATVERMLLSWSKTEDPEKAIFEDFVTLDNSGQLVEILNRLLVSLGVIGGELVKPLLSSLSRHIDSAPMGQERPKQDAQFKLILFLLDQRVPQNEKQAAAEAVIREIRSIDVAVRVANALSSEAEEMTWGLRKTLDVSEFKKLTQQRFENEIVMPKLDIFEVNNLPQYVLYQIGTYNSSAALMVNNYVMDLLKQKPNYIGKIIDGFFIAYQGGPHEFNFEGLKSIYDPLRLGDIARRAGENGWSTEKEKEAIRTFLNLLKGEDGITTQA